MASISIKRQKTSQCSDDSILNLASQPAEIFNGITSYLHNTSCALLGVSLTAPSSSTLWRDGSSTSLRRKLSPASTFILSSMIARGGDTTLDLRKDMFGERNLQENINDQDIHAILMFINAPEKLERLNFPLNRCTKITGIGLQPLYGSRVLEQLRLNSNYYMTTQRVSESESQVILPILSSIIRTDGNSLKYIQLPTYWRRGGQPLINNLLEEYNQLLDSRELTCHTCEGRCRQNGRSLQWMDIMRDRQNYTCSVCLNNFCGTSTNCIIRRCHHCSNDMCGDCAPFWCNECGKCSGCCNSSSPCEAGCGELYCEDCLLTCENCDRSGCKGCLDYKDCCYCGEGHCGNCFGQEDCNVVVCDGEGCVKEGEGYCQVCFVKDWEESTWDCNQCSTRYGEEAGAIISRLREEVELQRLEISSLRQENTELRRREEEH